jgi:hypothetical protein
MLFDQPHLYEVEDMFEFCKKYKHIYIYGCAENQEYLSIFLETCGTQIAGYITTREDTRELSHKSIPKYTLDTVNLDGAGIIIGLSDRYFDGVMPRLRERGFDDYFVMSEFNKIKIAHKMRPRERDSSMVGAPSCSHNRRCSAL